MNFEFESSQRVLIISDHARMTVEKRDAIKWKVNCAEETAIFMNEENQKL